MVTITEIQWVYLFISIFCLFPTILLLRYYKLTHVADYLIFAGVFICITINQFFTYVIIDFPTNIIVNQLVTSSYILVYLFIYLHAVRLQSEKPSKWVWMIGIVPYVVLQIMILLYEKHNLPESINFLYFTMHNVDSYEVGVGYTFNGKILMGQGFDYLISIYRILVMIYAVYVYFKVKIVVNDQGLNIVRNLWMAIGVFTMGRPTMYLIDLFTEIELEPLTRSSFDVFAILIIPFIIIKYPEYVLISNTQLVRASYLYTKIDPDQIDPRITTRNPDLVYAYIKNIQLDLVKNIKSVPKKIVDKAKKLGSN